jgi:predicted PurR-regulated permease PerM
MYLAIVVSLLLGLVVGGIVGLFIAFAIIGQTVKAALSTDESNKRDASQKRAASEVSVYEKGNFVPQ